MSDNIQYRRRGQAFSSIVESTVFTFILIFGLRIIVSGQSPPLSESVSQFNQAVQKKSYPQAAKYAYEIAKGYREAKDLNKAIEYLNQSLTYAKKSGDQNQIFSVYHQLGSYHLEAKKSSRALENFQSALSIARKVNDASLIKEELINVSTSYGNLEKFKKSIEYAEEALTMAITDHDTALQESCYQLLADYHAKQGNNKKSLEYRAQYDLLVTAQQNEALKARQIDELEQHLETAGMENQLTQTQLSEQAKKLSQTHASLRMIEKSLHVTTDSLLATTNSLKEIDAISKNRQMEIDLLQKNNELADIKIKEQEARIENEALARNFVLVGSSLSIALIGVVVFSYRKKIKANKQIEEQNKNIRSSINYAKRIQEAMLPKTEQYPSVFKDSFILFKPRDTVSGDFYWISEIKTGDVAFAAVDCTGHGVPGAFMSMIGIKALNGLINRDTSDTNLILDALDNEIKTALRQEVSGNNDGMDIALCIYREKEKMLEFSGAKNPLVYVQNHELFKVKGDTHSIGGRKKANSQFSFKKHQIKIDKPTVLYLFSDGYKDQFGGTENTKFLSKKLNKLLLQIHELPMADQLNILQLTLSEWKGNHNQTDDILVMGLKLDPTA
jgi:serine phosphatase RsbU (regulator of sigma subunit)